MADEQKIVDVLIRTKAELAGAQGLEQQLERDIGKAKALGDVEGLKKLQPQLDAVRASLKSATVDTEAASAATEEHNKHLEGSRLLLGELNKIVPGLGHMLHAAFAGPIGPAFALAMVVYEVKKSIDETNEALDKMGEKAAEADFLPGIEAKLEVMRSAIGAADAYVLKLADIKAGEHNVSTELAEQLKLDQAIERARAGLVSAQKALDGKSAQQMKRDGIDPEMG